MLVVFPGTALPMVALTGIGFLILISIGAIWNCRLILEWILRECEFCDRFSTNQVFANNALQYIRRHGVVPNPFRIDHGDRAAFANP